MLTALFCAAAFLAADPGATMPSSPQLLRQVDQTNSQPSAGAIVIDEVARRVLYNYYQQHLQAWEAEDQDQQGEQGKSKGKGNGNKNKQKSLPPGLAKKGKLPPGIEKQLVRNGQLPPGLAYHQLPPDLIVQLPPVQPGYRYMILDDRVMLIRAATDIIMDILQVPAAP